MAAPLWQEHPPPLRPGRIARLAPTTAQLVRSAAVVPSLPRMLAELVQNSIDASANSISCTVDLDTWTISCDDNGRGFTAQDLDCLARAQRYSTSKVTLAVKDTAQEVTSQVGAAGTTAPSSSSSYYGSRGEALVSLQYVATVEIRTRTLHDPLARELVLRQGMCLAHGESAIERPNHGASVIVRDIFHNLPVRRRALEKPAAHTSLVSSLRASLASLALIHPTIAFSLIDKTSLFSTHSTGSKTLLSVRPSPTGLVSARWRQLWGPAAVEKVHEFEEEEGTKLVNGEACGAKGKGFFSLAPAHTKAQQHIYVNSRPLSATHSSLHKLVNSLFEASTFAKHASAASAPSPPVARLRSGSQQQQQPKRTLERHPVFTLALEVPARGVTVAFEQENGVTVEFEEPARIEAFVTGIVKRFLVQHGFASAPITKKGSSVLPAEPTHLSSNLDVPLRKKRPRSDSSAQVGNEAGMREDAIIPNGVHAAVTSGAWSLSGLQGRAVVAAGGAVKASAPLLAIAGPAEPDMGAADDGQPPAMMRWTDPVTNILWEIDTKTGNSRRVDPARLHHDRAAAPGEPERGGAAESSPPPPPVTRASSWIVDRIALRNRNEGLNDSTETGEMPAWLEAKLATWTNPVFPSIRPEKTIPTLPVLPIASNLAQSSLRDVYPSSKKKRFVDTTSAAKPTRKDIDAFCCTSVMLTNSVPEPMSIPMAKISSSSSVQVFDPASASAPSSTPFSGQTFSRESLARAEFVAQVDRKYLLAKLPETTSSNVAGDARSQRTTQTLVLVDQHAASERVRVERFLDATVGNVARGEPIAIIRCSVGDDSDPDEAERASYDRIGVVVGRREYELAQQYRIVFARWGFTLAFDDDDEAPPSSSSSSPTTTAAGGGGGDYLQIWLESVPELVSNRLLKTKDSHLAQDLVRSFVAHLEENGPGVAGDTEYTSAAVGRGSSRGGGGDGRRRGCGGWTSAIKDAPPVLIELLNSKACRGAIMFNDELSAAQAESLLAILAKTIYPFQCAHGRPSVVPVVNLAPPRPRAAEATDPGVVDWSRLM